MGISSMKRLTMALLGLLAGCGLQPCPKCESGSAVEVTAVDGETGAPLLTIALSGTEKAAGNALSEAECQDFASGCRALTGGAGKIRVEVSAQGYQPASFEVQVDADHCGLRFTQHRKVALARLGAASQALVSDPGGFPGCH